MPIPFLMVVLAALFCFGISGAETQGNTMTNTENKSYIMERYVLESERGSY